MSPGITKVRDSSPRANYFSDGGLNEADGFIDPRGNAVLPEPQHFPPARLQELPLSAIPFHGCLDFFLPPRAVRLRNFEMDWAMVPEAPIDKDTDLLAREHDIGLAAYVRFGANLLPEPEAGCKKPLSQKDLGRGVPSFDRLHHPPDIRAGSGRRSGPDAIAFAFHGPGNSSSTSSGSSSGSDASSSSGWRFTFNVSPWMLAVNSPSAIVRRSSGSSSVFSGT